MTLDRNAMLESMQRTSLWIRWLTFVGVVLVIAIVIIYSQLTLNRVSSNLNSGHKTQKQIVSLGQQILVQQDAINRALAILEQATGEPAQQAQALQLQHLIECLYNRIDYDTRRTRTLEAGCNIANITPPHSTSTTTTTTQASAIYFPQGGRPTPALTPTSAPKTTTTVRPTTTTTQSPFCLSVPSLGISVCPKGHSRGVVVVLFGY